MWNFFSYDKACEQVKVGDFVTFRAMRQMEYRLVLVKSDSFIEYWLLLLGYSLKSFASLIIAFMLRGVGRIALPMFEELLMVVTKLEVIMIIGSSNWE